MRAIILGIVILFPFLTIAQTTTINYTESTADFPNPERGFYRYSSTHSDSYAPLNAATLAGYRSLHTPFSAGYDIYSTLVYRVFYLDDFTSSAISSSYLSSVQADFDAARTAGVKLIVRFAYTDNVDGSTCASWICPPYGDASKSWVLQHINQIKPYLVSNKDVIALVQFGFIGTWGEGYYTDYFGDASQSPYILTATNWDDRTEVLNAYLDAVPTDRMIQVRYPQAKQKAIYGNAAPTTSAAVSSAQAYDETNISRIGHHNDCYLASYTDFGTYNNYGPPSSFADTTNLKPYVTDDSRYVVVGGETCSEYAPFDNCATDGGYADTEMRRLHYSYLNSQYNNAVNNGWVGSCLDDVKKNLGYRLVLENGTYTNEAQPGQTISIDFNIKNVGYAAPYNPRGIEIILRNTATAALYFAELNTDPRFWLTGSHNVNEALCLPVDIPTGNYDLLLNLPDVDYRLYARPEYSIQLANNGIWEPATGYNSLGHTLTINNSATGMVCNTETVFQTQSTILPVELISFEAKGKEQHIDITWQTASETQHKGFFLERSTNGKDFTSIKWIEGTGDSYSLKAYHVVDEQVLPDSDYYYRLVQTDWDGTQETSQIRAARINKAMTLDWQIQPNPANQQLNIRFRHSLEEDATLHIINSNGQTLLDVPLQGAPTFRMDIEDWPSGLYYIRLMNRSFTETKLFIKE